MIIIKTGMAMEAISESKNSIKSNIESSEKSPLMTLKENPTRNPVIAPAIKTLKAFAI